MAVQMNTDFQILIQSLQRIFAYPCPRNNSLSNLSSVGDLDLDLDLGLPDPDLDLLVRGMDPDPDPSLFS